ncbi:MAG: beta-galactosidase [Clostridiales bacterium]|nr:beta-galactosidase [Clostridiales bacterium]
MKIGVAYYPEHWDKALWAADVDLMQQTGVKLVRLAEFAWCRLEPQDGVFDFAWLDEAIELFASRGIEVVLCTPTSCPPLWLYEKHPDIVHVEKDGTPTNLGIRSHRCVTNPTFLRYADRITIEMAKHYADNPAVTGWQIDNELEAYFCYCGHCAGKYRAWLQRKYGTVEKLNNAYGNVVWSGEYSAWPQIKPPYGSLPHAWQNPAYMLDFYRFCSDNVIDFSNRQAAQLREHCPGRPVTTNVWFCEHMPDFYRQFADLDFISYDNYPATRLPGDNESCYSHAFHLDMMRGVKRRPFWIMEQLSGGKGCWAPMEKPPLPGMIKGYSLQAFAHGADTVVHFRWRTANIGAEMHWHGLLDHSNVPGRRFREFADLCKTAQELERWQGSEIRSDVAILFSFDNEYAFKIQPQTEGYYYFEQLQRLHRAFTALGLNVDIIGQHEKLNGYRIVCAPEMYVHGDGVVERLEAFARQGGTVILTTRSGVKDEHNNACMTQLPGVFRDMTGVHAVEYAPIGWDSVPVRFADGTELNARQWCDVLEADTAEVLARYHGDYFAGAAAVTRNAFGEGVVYYIGAVGTQPLYERMARMAAEEAALPVVSGLPERVEMVTRTQGTEQACFVFNNDDKPKAFQLEGREIRLAPFEMRVIGKNG